MAIMRLLYLGGSHYLNAPYSCSLPNKPREEFDMREVKIIQYGVGAMGSLMVKTALKRKGLRFVDAIESLAKTRVYCDATNRIIHLDRGEIVKAIENLPKAGTFGEGPERRLFKSRRPEDKNPPWCHVGAGIVASKEEIALAQVEGYASIPQACFTRKKIAAKCRRIGRELDGMMGNPRPPKGFTPTIKQRSPPAVYLVNGR